MLYTIFPPEPGLAPALLPALFRVLSAFLAGFWAGWLLKNRKAWMYSAASLVCAIALILDLYINSYAAELDFSCACTVFSLLFLGSAVKLVYDQARDGALYESTVLIFSGVLGLALGAGCYLPALGGVLTILIFHRCRPLFSKFSLLFKRKESL